MPLPTLDSLDLKLLQALQLDGRAPFKRIASVLGVSDQTVARRYRRLLAAVDLRVLGRTDDARLARQNWIVRLHCTPDVAERLAGALAKRPDTIYVALMSGGTEVICGMKPRSTRERDELLLERLPRTPHVGSVTAHCLLHRFYGGPLGWLAKIDALDRSQQEALRPPAPAPLEDPVLLDAADDELLALLSRDGRSTLSTLQTVTGQPESAVKRRLDRLRSTGVLYFDVQYDHATMGHDVQAMLWLTVAPHATTAAGQALASHPEVQFASATTGLANLVVFGLFRSPEHVYAYLSDKIGSLEGIRSAETAFILRQVKQLTYEPSR
ncbi:Lrp/AsnC family transcriptional regulator [Streptomyces sp. Ncost-T10-10d]|uniref:Lrp/AsnC family transcriptional regulator n=1 Tax=Streptomyces sp. Ncost-T10-10d TaxID=1839774 RepID=UPI00081E0FB0|nr:Lrp/AsnC family transcriptional regulator [Streptomyces sp. Ncost-T10-10d]SCF68607.1 transcriptional regulator, AsnC family [Streptomyces sp. Ncost-T10-10d]